MRRSIGAGLEQGEINVRAGDGVEVIGEDVQGDVGNDFSDESVGEARLAQGLEVRITDLAALEGDGLSKAQHGLSLEVRGSRPARGANLVIVEAKLPGESVVGREAILGAVDFRNGQSKEFALARGELALGERSDAGDIGRESRP